MIQHTDMPAQIIGSIYLMAASLTTIVGTTAAKFFADFPTPADASEWSFRGVLIVAVCVLAATLGVVLRWVANRGIEEMAANREQMSANREILSDFKEVLNRLVATQEKTTEWFERLGREALEHAVKTSLQNQQSKRSQ